MYSRQPPSLIASATHVPYNITFNIDRFELTADATCDPYVYAVRSGRADISRLLPPHYPKIMVLFRFEPSDRKRHDHCPGGGSWCEAHEKTFENRAQAIEQLINDKDEFLYTYCTKLLSFLPSCEEHLV